jgi:acyl carrier protein
MTSPDSVDRRLKRTICSALRIPEDLYSEELTAGDIPQWDSLGHLQVVMAVEQEFDVAFDVTDMLNAVSVSDFLDLLNRCSPGARV